MEQVPQELRAQALTEVVVVAAADVADAECHHKDPQARLAHLAMMDRMEDPAVLAIQDLMLPQPHNSNSNTRPASIVNKHKPDRQAHLDHPDQMATPEHLDRTPMEAAAAHLAHPAHLDQLDNPEDLARLEDPDNLDKSPKFPAAKAHLAQPAHLDPMENPEAQDSPEDQASPVSQAHLETTEHPVDPEILEAMASQDKQETKVARELATTALPRELHQDTKQFNIVRLAHHQHDSHIFSPIHLQNVFKQIHIIFLVIAFLMNHKS